MKKLFLATAVLLVATPALADIPNDGNGVRKNGNCVIEVTSMTPTFYYYEPCSNENVCCEAGWGTPCTIDGELGEPHRFLPWEEPKNPPKPPADEPSEKPSEKPSKKPSKKPKR